MRLKRFLTACLFLAGLTACSEKKGVPMVPQRYEGWSRVNAVELDYPIPGHMDNYRVIYINDIGKGYRVETRGNSTYHVYPEGSIILKEIYESPSRVEGEKPGSLTVMVKDSDHPDAREDWVWIVKDLKTNQEQVMTQEFCVTCHSNANEEHFYGDGNKNGEFRDFVFFPY